MNLRGILREEDAHVVIHPDSSDVERYRVHTHQWRTSEPQPAAPADQSSRSRGISSEVAENEILVRSEDVRLQEQREAEAERYRIHTHHWRAQDQPQQNAARSRNVDDGSDEDSINRAEEARLQAQRAAEAEKYRIHTHQWRPEAQPAQPAAESRSRNVRDTEDDIVNRGEDARLQELREQDSKKLRGVYEIQERSEEEKQREQREADAERYRIHTHHWRPEQGSEQSTSTRSRNVFNEVNEEDLINRGEDVRLQEQREAEAARYRVHTHVWRPQQYNSQQRNVPNDVVFQEGQVDAFNSANARTVDDGSDEDSINRAEEARLQAQRAAEAEKYRIHTHQWRPEAQPAQPAAESRSRNVRNAEDDIIARGEEARLQEQLRSQEGLRNIRTADTTDLSRVHTHVWRQESYQAQEQREADIARAVRARNMRSVPEPVNNVDQNRVHTHVWRGAAPVNDINEEARVRHGQHLPDTPFQEYQNDQARSYQARDAEVSRSQDNHIPRGMQLPQANQQSNGEARGININ